MPAWRFVAVVAELQDFSHGAHYSDWEVSFASWWWKPLDGQRSKKRTKNETSWKPSCRLAPCKTNTAAEQNLTKSGTELKIIWKVSTPTLMGDVSLACYFYCAVQNETVGSSKLEQSLYGGKNQYSNIRARLIRGSVLLRGHWGATAFKWGIQLWNIVWDKLRLISD